MVNIGVIGYGYWGPNLVRNFSGSPKRKFTRWRISMRNDSAYSTSAIRPLRSPRTIGRCFQIRHRCGGDRDTRLHAFRTGPSSPSAGKHVFIEKPLTETAEQAERLISEADKRDLVLHVDHTFIYTGAVRKMRELVEKGEHWRSVLLRLRASQSGLVSVGCRRHVGSGGA